MYAKTMRGIVVRYWMCLFTLLFSLTAFAEENKPVVEVKTSQGSFKLELYPDKAPRSVENFLRYARDGFYKDTIFHLVVKDYMIQGGGYGADYQKKLTREPIFIEADNGLSNTRGMVSMARMYSPNSATSQFFINTKDNPKLDHTEKTPKGWGYTVFGKVISGMDVVAAIEGVKTGEAGPFKKYAPIEPVLIEEIIIEKDLVGAGLTADLPPPETSGETAAEEGGGVEEGGEVPVVEETDVETGAAGGEEEKESVAEDVEIEKAAPDETAESPDVAEELPEPPDVPAVE